MAHFQEKRKYDRHSHEAPVMIYTKDNPEMSYYGQTYDYSKKGMYLETDADLKAGKYYVIKILSYYDDEKGPEPYIEHCGTVRWTQQNKQQDTDNSGISYCYGYGMECL
ncbi:MAG: PilZ domain-containing protein [Desulfurivibrionaceae bacterium]